METNLLVYDCHKLMREVKRLDTVLEQKREAEEKLPAKIRHYSVRNVNKRDQTAREHLCKLRDLQRKVQKLKKNQINIQNFMKSSMKKKTKTL